MDAPTAACPDRRSPDAGPCPEGTVVIVGGGFGGLYTALALSQQPAPPPILLIEPQERFLFLPLLYELLSDELRRWEIAPPYEDLLAGRGVAWLRDRVERIDTTARLVHTSAGRSVAYASLVIACGGGDCTFGVPGAERHSQGFRSLADVERLQTLLRALREQRHPLQRVAIVGAGPTGVELACKLADLAEGSAVIELIERGSRPLPQGRAFNRQQAELALQRRDVRVRTHTQVAAIEADHVVLRSPTSAESAIPATNEILPVRGVIWTAGLGFRPPVITPSVATDSRGRLRCDPELRLLGHSDVYALGDLASPTPVTDPGQEEATALPSTAQVAFQQAALLSANLMRARGGEPLLPFVWNDLGEMLSLGKGDACLTGGGLTLAGPAAYQLRRLAYLTRLPGLPHQLRVGAGWLADCRP